MGGASNVLVTEEVYSKVTTEVIIDVSDVESTI